MRDDPFVKSKSVPTPAAWAAIVESSEDAIIGMTLDGIVTSWNPAAERIYGYTASDILGYKLQRLVPEELRDVETKRIARVASGTPQRVNDMPRMRKDGARLVVWSSMFPVRDDHRVTSIALIEHDATRRRALEAQLLQAKRMEAVGRLAGGVAQEFNNINTAILGLVEFLSDRVRADPTASADLDEITKQALRGARLSQHILAFSGRRSPSNGPVDVGAALRSMEPLLQRLVGEGVWLTLDLDDDGAAANVEEAQLELVLFELVMHAADAIGDRGSVTVATRRTIVNENSLPTPAGVPSGSYLEIAVRDSGRAAAAERVPNGPDPLEESGEPGTDLGLAMVYSIVERIGGYIATTPLTRDEVEVAVFLPLAARIGLQEDADRPMSARGGTETILLVEDEDGVRSVVARALAAQGYRVLEARHGEDALDVAEAHKAPIHIVVSDVVMPHMDGGALFERLRGWYPQLRFLFVSGYTRGAITAEHLRGPFTDFLAKPFTLEQLGRSVRALLDRGHEASSADSQ